MRTRSNKILGISCAIKDKKIRRAIRRVLCAVNRFPRDSRRLQMKVRSIAFSSRAEAKPESMGGWKRDPDALELTEGLRGTFEGRGIVLVSRKLLRYPESLVVAIVAHEFGHVVTNQREFEIREEDTENQEWACEMCADRYVFKWGFEKELRQASCKRSFIHHGCLPGGIIQIGSDGVRFKCDKTFRLRRLWSKEEADRNRAIRQDMARKYGEAN